MTASSDFSAGIGLWAGLATFEWFPVHPFSPKAMVVFDVNGDGDDDAVFSFRAMVSGGLRRFIGWAGSIPSTRWLASF